MIALDLFGNERELPGLRAPSPPAQLDLLRTAAHLAALASGRPASQEYAELIAPRTDPPAGLFARTITNDLES